MSVHNQIMMNFQVDEFSKLLQNLNSCPDNDEDSNSFLSIFLGSETRDQIVQEILKHVTVKVDCLPNGFQENQFFSPAQTKYSCYVNDQVRISVHFDNKYLDSLSQGQNECDQSPNYFCSMLMEKCEIQLVSFVEGTSFENTLTELTTELCKLGMNSDSDNQRVVTFHVPRPIQKRGKKKERANSVSKKIGFIQIVHSDTKKIICRSDNMWIRSKSREEMETKKRRANHTLSKKVKKRKIKADDKDENTNQDSNKPDSTKPDLSSNSAPAPTVTNIKSVEEIPDLKPKFDQIPVSHAQFPFLPIMPSFPNFVNTNLLSLIPIPVNNCCSLIPVQACFDPSISNQFSAAVNYFCQANSDILELTQPNVTCDEFDFDFETTDKQCCDELHSPLSDISSKQCEINDNLWGEVSPISDSLFNVEDDFFHSNSFEFI